MNTSMARACDGDAAEVSGSYTLRGSCHDILTFRYYQGTNILTSHGDGRRWPSPSWDDAAQAVTVAFHRRAHLPILMASGLFEESVRVPWWGNRTLRLTTYSG